MSSFPGGSAGPSRIPIDPALLAGEDIEMDDPFEDDLFGLGEGEQSQSSGAEDGDEGDDYVEEDEGVLADIAKEGEQAGEDDVIFNRLAGYVSRSAPGGEGGLGVGGSFFQEQMESFDQEELPQTTRKAPRRGRRPHRMNHETEVILGQANMNFIQGQTGPAKEGFLEVIRQDPYVHSAWVALASCYDMEGDVETARQMRFFGAHIEGDADAWKELAKEFREQGQDAQALYCFRKALRADPSDIFLLLELTGIYRQQGKTAKAVDAFKKILKASPPTSRDFTFLMDFQPLLLEVKQSAFAAQIFRSAFDYHIERFSSPEDQRPDEPNTLALEHVVILADMLLASDDLEEALVVIRRGQRWLQGRREQRSWDANEDDREYDPEGLDRGEQTEQAESYPLEIPLRHRLALVRLRLGDDDEALIHIDEILQLDVMQYHQFFLDLGNALLKREMWEKALDCFATIHECESIPDDPSHIYAIGVCHHQMKDNAQALEALRWVANVDPSHYDAQLRLANVLEDMGQKAEALEIVMNALKNRSRTEAAAPAEKHSKAERAAARKLNKRVLEDQMRGRMQGLWADVISAEEGIGNGEPGALDKFIYSAGTMIETFRLAKSNFGKNRGVVRIATERKGQKQDFDTRAKEIQDRLERTMGFEDETPQEEPGPSKYLVMRQTDFYGLDMEEWLVLVIKYCCVLMVKSEEDVAMDILEHVVWSGLFNNPRAEVALRLAIVACGMRIRAYDKITDNCKRLSQMHQFRAEPLLLMLGALGGGGLKAHKAWVTLALQKFMQRELRIYDDATKGRTMHYSTKMGRWALPIQVGVSRWAFRTGKDEAAPPEEDDEEGEDEDDRVAAGGAEASTTRGASSRRRGEVGDEDEDDEDEDYEAERAEGDAELDVPKPTKPSPNFNTIYGQAMLSNKSYQTSLFYFFRAYESNQYDPLICLQIAQAFLGRSLNRQADNRNYMIAQGMAFMTRYRKLSAKDAVSLEEVEYNYGRAFHGIGIAHLAIVHYEKVLESIKIRMNEADDPESVRQISLAHEAAHNLMLLYAATGSTQLAKKQSHWLAI